jgi:hypothetical protein
MLPYEKNCIKRDAPLIRNRLSRFSNDISFNGFKNSCKFFKCTLNEATLSIIGQTLKEYAMRRNDTNLSKIMMCTTFSLKNFPENVEGITGGNGFVPQYISIPVLDKFEDCL